MVDLDGAKAGKPANLTVLERVAKATTLVIDHGGGIKTDEDLQSVFDAGAAMANIGSLAVTKPEQFIEWLHIFGSDRFLLGADVRDRMIAINGWQTVTEISVFDHLAKFAATGLSDAFVTDIAHDGAMNGPAIELYREIIAALPALNLIASGGVSSVADLYVLDSIGCSGAIVGKALYEGTIALEELAKYVG
jgi:phosphoribosylformimino-5-aminoimidazole carboxamide ribotide isomerase